jgi:hypothetical protein
MPGNYLSRYAEPEAGIISQAPPSRIYDYCLLIPAYRESASLCQKLLSLAPDTGDLLVILVLNYPDNNPARDCNDALREAVHRFPRTGDPASSRLEHAHCTLHALTPRLDVLLVERPQALPSAEGVGLARKLAGDIAAALHSQGRIRSRWLHNTDADAVLPRNYFSLAEQQPRGSVAIVHPFAHRQAIDADQQAPELAMNLYELQLHYYVMGLRSAASPYAFHSIGSCLSVDVKAYQQVRGFPRRAGAEDFYLLNKVAKLGPVATGNTLITLEARFSDRVPFGTGPGMHAIAVNDEAAAAPLFYHPDCFSALARVLGSVESLYQHPDPLQLLESRLLQYAPAFRILSDLGIEKCLQHCARQSRSGETFGRHFQQWFDGFRTLKFIHGLRDAGKSNLTLKQSLDHPDSPWPSVEPEPAALLRQCRAHLGWH